MTTFPSIEPDTRSLVYGDYPQNTHEEVEAMYGLLANKRVEQD